MLKVGLIGLAIAVGGVALLLLLGLFGMMSFGPCGPANWEGLVLLLGSVLCGILGIALTIVGLIAKGVRKFRHKKA